MTALDRQWMPTRELQCVEAPRTTLPIVVAYLVFGALGVVFGVWQVLLTDLAHALHLSEGALSAVLTVGFISSLPTMIVAGRHADQIGHTGLMVGAAIGLSLGIVGVAVANGVAVLVGVLLCYFAASGAYDVGINAAAMDLEREVGPRLMPLLHGTFSGGAAAGALVAGGLLAAGAPFRTIYAGTAVLLIALAGLVWWRRPSGDRRAARPAPARRTGGDRLGLFRRRAVLLAAAITALAFFSEGVVTTWAVIYLRDTLALPTLIGASGAAVFNLAMMVGRFGTAGVVLRFGRWRVLRIAGVIATVGMGLALATTWSPAILLGFLIVGLAVAGIAPIAYSLGGDAAPDAIGEASSVLTTVGYSGFLVAPSLVGAIAAGTNLRVALATVCFAGLVVTLLAMGRTESLGERGTV